ncbi:MAG TPA: 50S ribosomal protein L4 [Bacteroidia bacterium]|nr:50S ribosomal protein L4 [Bacteroidia bacterium]HRS59007.1 50S ribosomal protein L4 [Bacteroidia bacterium]HRU68113.1 50S ribosomal protein L4 [Bacteroidia bacterium]
MKVEVYTINGEKTDRQIDLPDEIFAVKPNDHAIYLDVKRIMASFRQGTHKAKERAEVSGSTKKLRRQKGTGAARVGSIKNPLFRGGGRIFGPRPRDYAIKLNKKVRELARKSALSYKLIENKIKVVEDFDFEQPKTKEFASILKNLQAKDSKNLFVVNIEKENIYLSGRNLSNTYICPPENLNTYVILDNDLLVLTESSVEIIKKTFLN